MPFRFQRLRIPDVVLIEPVVFEDERGFFMETYKYSEFAEFGITERFVQDNHSRSARGVLRGLHYQKAARVQGKLVRAIAGEVYDVAVDIRTDSPTYRCWVGDCLSAANRRMLYVPAGFAHGFCVLSESAEVVYKTTDEYASDHECGIIWNDPDLAIEWPVETPVLGARDAALPRLIDAGNDF